jgi:2-C-methyl-D-erythritol 4-phosphate cytidylyltransferase
MKEKNAVIIVAGGIGLRMGSAVPKQFLLIAGKPVLMHTIEKFIAFDNSLEIIVTLPEKQKENWKKLCIEHNFNFNHKVVSGGITRFHSVRNALAEISNSSKLIAVHDGVRPLIDLKTIQNCFELAEQKGCAIPFIPISESIRRISENSSEIVDRSGICAIQTPQVFSNEILKQSYLQTYNANFTDDASVVEKAGFQLSFTEGNRENIKITFPQDVAFAEKFL